MDFDYEIVLATENDREEVLAIYKAQLGRPFCPWDDEYPSNGTIDFDLERDSLFVLKSEGKIIGCFSVEDDEQVDNLECWDRSLFPGGELARLAVLPEMQNRGIAKLLVEYGLAELKRRGFKSIHFLVDKHNVKALKAYSHFGFKTVGETFMYEHEYFCCEKKLENNF